MPKWKTKFSQALKRDFDFLEAVEGDEHSVFCTFCQKKLSIANGGRSDIKTHIMTSRHRDIAETIPGYTYNFESQETQPPAKRQKTTKKTHLQSDDEDDLKNIKVQHFLDEESCSSSDSYQSSEESSKKRRRKNYKLKLEQRIDSLEDTINNKLNVLENLMRAVVRRLDAMTPENHPATSRLPKIEPRPKKSRPAPNRDVLSAQISEIGARLAAEKTKLNMKVEDTHEDEEVRKQFFGIGKHYYVLDDVESVTYCMICKTKFANKKSVLVAHLQSAHPKVFDQFLEEEVKAIAMGSHQSDQTYEVTEVEELDESYREEHLE